ncbi:MAG: exopolysaccharide biosynthesis polyprenyl glycosylphosphotransferase [Brevundimonas sp.]|uniref:exopolysaccharide biosynthesis polyprenyl glycosylphosphotransferase n=1 Tax=Brevundimonas sp. TaxID=1871086 RepID=UPI0025C213A6|nr:exopolysaccharide biosynthesis polyprenyl glycosylphosphotransferase [Brevundimonas sp.]MBX3476051.1 exopolysaccharide biosynthesis polyprenyl glycosylphosphotransferase [Brevundimonas sp.]
MADSLSRLPSTAQAAPATAGAPALQAYAAHRLETAPADGAARRGPFRPDVWLNARQRGAARLAPHYFRAADAALVFGLALACAWAAAPSGLLQAPLAQGLPYLVGAAAVLWLLRRLDLYRFGRDEGLGLHLAKVSACAALGGVLATGLTALLAPGAATVAAALVWSALTLLGLYALHMLWREGVGRWRASGALTPNLVIVGATRHAEALIHEALKRRDLNILGVFDDRLARSPQAVSGVPVLGRAEDLLSHRLTPYVDRIVLAIDPRAEARVRDLTRRLAILPNPVTLLVDPHGADERDAALERLVRTPLASLDGPVDPDRKAFHKRLQDLALGLTALVLLAPVLALIALFVRLDSPGPALFRQRRHGFNHEEIVVWKFRTMRHEAADASASRQVTADDDRVTRLGRFLRATSLDELPQLLNVVRGEMSLVGPRPHAIGMKTGQVESARMVADYAHRHRIKPGMTGWAAIKGSRGPLHTAADVRRRVQLDVEYIERQSFWLDLWIMLVTVPVLLGDRMAVR